MGQLLKIIGWFALVSLLWWGGARFLLPPPEDARATLELILTKEEIARQIEPPRVVILGGSSSRYGFSAEQLSAATGLRAVNLGTHAGLGGRYLLDRAKQNLRAGDLAIIALEPGFYIREDLSVVTARFVQFATPGYLFRAPAWQWPQMIFGVSPHDLLRSYALVAFVGDTPNTVGAQGDEMGSGVENVTDYYRALVERSAALRRPLVTVENMPDYLREFIGWAHNNGVALRAAWPVVFYRPEYESEAYAASFASITETFESLGVPVLGSQLDFALPLELMFDTAYHANSNGRTAATEALIHAITEATPAN